MTTPQAGAEITDMHRKLSNYCRGMGDLVSQVLDLTYPAVSMLRGRSFNRSADTDLSQPLTADSVIHDAFRDKAIEDLWLPYFCIRWIPQKFQL